MTTTQPTITERDLARLEIRCSGCDRWESIDVDPEALTAYRAGDLNERQAFPTHTSKLYVVEKPSTPVADEDDDTLAAKSSK